ncbi:hypothetical protein IQ241_18325 [Romeria aff. gracilis LEGE 07310]|uniref:DUF6737 domain-containing protein n=1 Tax=Vasconcelosia minhoensis LEGE 07310 TaxID=915328 RepID=A0A8J7AQC6_9CYAN|nr:DUF6737 family protein [Romeria gracilis]MBE9079230.1 hypothetical protein [Romeria aff. gracilis LEGE 07310]
MTDSTPPPDSLWQLKPWWCQPWSIVLTGIAMPAAVWLLTHRLWLVTPVFLFVMVWWFLFLYLVPKQYREDLLSKKS